MSVIDVLSGLATAAGKGFEGYALDEREKVARAVAQRKSENEARQLAVTEALAGRTLRTPVLGDPAYTKAEGDVAGAKANAELPAAIQKTEAGVKAATGVHEANRTFDVAHPLPDNTLVPVQHGDAAVYEKRAGAEGKTVPSPNSTGSAAMQKAIASNRTQLSVLDDALREIGAHPQAVGLNRGAGELVSSVPVVGSSIAAMQDAANQRVDPEGTKARASLANVGSIIIHDRSGAAVTVSEYPRLKPFIPTSSDTPEAIRDKIGKLKQAIQTETDFLSAGRGTPAPAAHAAQPSPPTASVPSYEDWKKANGIP